MELKTILTDSVLLMPEIATSGQTEHNERHRAKISGVKDIRQTDVSSSPDVTTKFRETQIKTQMSQYMETFTTPRGFVYTRTVRPETKSPLEVLKELKYNIPLENPATDTQSTSQGATSVKSDDEDKQKVGIYDEGFKIPQGTAHRKKKKLDAETRRRIVSLILAKELDPFSMLIDIVKVRYELKPYGLNENEWRSYLLNLKSSSSHRNAILAQIARKLVKDLEPKINEVELIRDLDKNPLEPQALKIVSEQH